MLTDTLAHVPQWFLLVLCVGALALMGFMVAMVRSFAAHYFGGLDETLKALAGDVKDLNESIGSFLPRAAHEQDLKDLRAESTEVTRRLWNALEEVKGAARERFVKLETIIDERFK